MNLGEIIALVNTDIDDVIDNGVITKWVNRALDIVSSVAKYKKRITLLFDEGVSDYEFPGDLIELVGVYGPDGKLDDLELTEYDLPGYKTWGTTIGFQNIEAVSVDLYYHASYPHVSSMDDVPKLPSIFHDLLVLYAVGRLKYQEEEEDRFIAGAVGEFGGRLEAFKAFVEKNDKRQKRVKMITEW